MVGEPSRRAAATRTSRSAAATSRATSATRGSSATSRSTSSRARSPRRASTSASRAARTRPSTPRRRAARSSSPRRAPRSSRTRTTGIERWFEPGSELLVVETPTRRSRRIAQLLDDPAQAEEIGRRARERVLDEHTYRHRARQLLELRRPRTVPVMKSGSRSSRRFNEEGAIGRVIDELRAFDPELDVVVVDDGSRRRDRRRARASTARTSSRCRSTSASAAPSRPASATRPRTATTSRSASTATASTIRPSSRALLGPVLAGEADICVGSRFAGADGYRSSAARRVGIRILARTVSLADRPARHRHDQRVPGAEPQGDRAVRRRLPARLPGGRGGGDGAQAPSAAGRGARDDARARSPARRRSAASRSVYYMAKVHARDPVGALRRRATPLEDA